MTYCRLSYTGEFKNLETSLLAKIPDCKITYIDTSNCIAVIDNVDDMYYLLGLDLDNDVRITNIEVGDKDKYKEFLVQEQKSELVESIEKETCGAPLIQPNQSQSQSQSEASSDPRINLNNALLNTTLKSKSPLQPEDPMNYILSKGYLLVSSFTISALLLLSNIF